MNKTLAAAEIVAKLSALKSECVSNAETVILGILNQIESAPAVAAPLPFATEIKALEIANDNLKALEKYASQYTSHECKENREAHREIMDIQKFILETLKRITAVTPKA